MELLSRKFVRSFYFILIASILFHLVDASVGVLNGGCKLGLSIVILFSVINVMLLISNIRFNIKQQFEECKVGAKALCITMIPLLVADTLCVWKGFRLFIWRDNIIALIVIELVLLYRIHCIEYLEKMAKQLKK